MDNIIEIYQEQLEKEEAKLEEILEEMRPLEQKKSITEQNIKALKHLVDPAVKSESSIITGSLVGKTGKPAYKEIARDHFRGKPFRERQIREHANKEGLRIKDEPIKVVYSRGIIAELLKEGFLEKVDRGVFKCARPLRMIDIRD